MTHPPSVGLLGCGQMATALARGWLAAAAIDSTRSLGSAPRPAARQSFTAATGLSAVADNAEVVAASDVLVLAVKPQKLHTLCDEIRPHLTPEHLVVSIAAGVPLARLASWLGDSIRLARVMPNTPCLVGASASGYSLNDAATADDAATVERLFAAVGLCVGVPEPLIDAVTAVSGSGPVYGYMLAEAMADGGVRAGLPRAVAQQLAAQTLLGAAKMLLETGDHPATLKDRVASPAGTTIEAIATLERHGFRHAVVEAVAATHRRAVELGQTS